MIRAIIVEDERALRTLISKFIAEVDDDVQIVGEAGTIKEAQEVIKKYSPDIVFLDIQLPGGTSFDLLESLGEVDFEVIFITAYDDYFMDAFKHAAVGYVLKPVDKEELSMAISNAKKRVATRKKNKEITELLKFFRERDSHDHPEKIGVPTQGGLDFIATADIIRCEGQSAYTKIVLRSGPAITSSYNLAHFKKLLPEEHFFPVHKSHIVSLSLVSRYNSKESIVEMINGDQVPVSRNAKSDFISHFKIPKR